MTRLQSVFAAVLAAGIVVVDGDTIKVRGETWRLRGFDAPEVRRAKCDRERRLGVTASAALRFLIARAGRIETRRTHKRDQYGRVLGDLYVDGRSVGDVLREGGLAKPYNGRGKRPNWCSA